MPGIAKSFADFHSFSRATSAYQFQADTDLLETVGIDVPRAFNNGRGLLNEGAAQQFVPTARINDLTSYTLAGSVVTLDGGASPIVGVTASRLSDNGDMGTGNVWAFYSVAIAPNQPNTVLALIKGNGAPLLEIAAENFGTNAAAIYNLTTGAVDGTQYAPLTTGIMPLGDGYYLCWLTFDPGADASGTVTFYVRDTLGSRDVVRDGTKQVFIAGHNITDTAGPGSFIDAQTSRAADVCDLSGDLLTGVLAAKSLYFEFELPNEIANIAQIFLISESTHVYTRLINQSGLSLQRVEGAGNTLANEMILGGGAGPTDVPIKLAFRQMDNDLYWACHDGTTLRTGSSSSFLRLANPTTVNLFKGFSVDNAEGYMRSIVPFVTALDDQTLQDMVTLGYKSWKAAQS